MNETVLTTDILRVLRVTEDSGDQWYEITDPAAGYCFSLTAQQWESLRAALFGEHPGIELRVSNLSGELTRANSDDLHHAARFGESNGDGWLELLPGNAWSPDIPLPARLKIEIRPVTLGGEGVDVEVDHQAVLAASAESSPQWSTPTPPTSATPLGKMRFELPLGGTFRVQMTFPNQPPVGKGWGGTGARSLPSIKCHEMRAGASCEIKLNQPRYSRARPLFFRYSEWRRARPAG